MTDTNTCLETKEPKEVFTSDIDPNAPKREIQIKSIENEQFILTIFQSKDSLIFVASKKDDIKAIKYKNHITSQISIILIYALICLKI